MRRKYKLTGCARFLIFLVIAVPVIFFTAQYITGNNPLTELKVALGWEKESVERVIDRDESNVAETTNETLDTTNAKEIQPASQPPMHSEKVNNSDFESKIKSLEGRIEGLENRIKKLEEISRIEE